MRDKKTMKRAVFPGSFDPVTVGHMDLIVRSAKMFDEVIVGVLRNAAKQPLCTVAERVSLLQELTAEIPGVRIEAFDGLLIDFVDKMDACAVIRGLRTAADKPSFECTGRYGIFGDFAGTFLYQFQWC